MALVDGFLAVDQILFDERFDDPAALARGELQFLPEVALVDAAGLADELETRSLVLVEFGFGRGTAHDGHLAVCTAIGRSASILHSRQGDQLKSAFRRLTIRPRCRRSQACRHLLDKIAVCSGC